jgi:hypothetical protein
MRIIPKSIKGTLYSYAQWSVRVKLDGCATGKTKGSGKSRVCTRSLYLGTAEKIAQALTGARAAELSSR